MNYLPIVRETPEYLIRALRELNPRQSRSHPQRRPVAPQIGPQLCSFKYTIAPYSAQEIQARADVGAELVRSLATLRDRFLENT